MALTDRFSFLFSPHTSSAMYSLPHTYSSHYWCHSTAHYTTAYMNFLPLYSSHYSSRVFASSVLLKLHCHVPPSSVLLTLQQLVCHLWNIKIELCFRGENVRKWPCGKFKHTCFTIRQFWTQICSMRPNYTPLLWRWVLHACVRLSSSNCRKKIL